MTIVRDDVKCRCVGGFGPNPECGSCGGSGCIAAEIPTPADQIQAAREAPVKIDGIPVLVRGTSGWSVIAEDGTRFNLVPAGRTALAREENDRG